MKNFSYLIGLAFLVCGCNQAENNRTSEKLKPRQNQVENIDVSDKKGKLTEKISCLDKHRIIAIEGQLSKEKLEILTDGSQTLIEAYKVLKKKCSRTYGYDVEYYSAEKEVDIPEYVEIDGISCKNEYCYLFIYYDDRNNLNAVFSAEPFF